jgi:hypothetical protein
MVHKTEQSQTTDWRQNEAQFNGSTSQPMTGHCRTKVCSTLKTKGLSTLVWLLGAFLSTPHINQLSQPQLVIFAQRGQAQNRQSLPQIQPQHLASSLTKIQLELSSTSRQFPRLLRFVLKERSTTHRSGGDLSKFRSKSSAKKQLLRHNNISRQCERRQPPNKLRNYLQRERCYWRAESSQHSNVSWQRKTRKKN